MIGVVGTGCGSWITSCGLVQQLGVRSDGGRRVSSLAWTQPRGNQLHRCQERCGSGIPTFMPRPQSSPPSCRVSRSSFSPGSPPGHALYPSIRTSGMGAAAARSARLLFSYRTLIDAALAQCVCFASQWSTCSLGSAAGLSLSAGRPGRACGGGGRGGGLSRGHARR